MTQANDQSGVWFVYDGDCPICERAAEALRIKKSLGSLNLLDARTETKHPLLKQINDRGLDLDEGMVIFHADKFYHGNSALWFMAVHGAPDGWFNHVNRLLFRSEPIARTLYPLMRAGRNLLLKLRGKTPIDNLSAKKSPIFRPVFGSAWEEMPPVMHAHYANRPFSDDHLVAKGLMSVEAGWLLRVLAPLSRVLGGIPAYPGKNIPVTVHFESEPDGKGLVFNRVFQLKGRKPYVFRSTMVPLRGNLLVEKMQFGLCWRVRFDWQDDQVKLHHAGYAINLFGWLLTVPFDWLLGRIDAHENADGPNHFSMAVRIHHPWWGTYYRYSGSFEMMDDQKRTYDA